MSDESSPEEQAKRLPDRYAAISHMSVAEIIEELPCVFYVIGEDHHLMIWNRQLEKVLDMSSDAIAACRAEDFFPPHERETVSRKMDETLHHGHSTMEAHLVNRSGQPTPYLFHCAHTRLDGQDCIFGTGLDITVRKKMEHGLLISERAIHSSVNAVVITCCKGSDNLIEYVNPAFEQITGYTLAEIKGRDPRFMGLRGCDDEERARVRSALKHKESVRTIMRNVRKNGEVFWNELRIDPVVNEDGKVTHFVGVINDITEARHYERRLHHLAHHDALTGLANRTLLLNRLGEAVEHAIRDGTQGALAFLDLDNFKHINDQFGHEAGDVVLREVATRLRANMRDVDTVARLGGDEFVLLMGDQPSAERLADLIERIRAHLTLPISTAGHEIVPGTSIGIALFPRDGDNADRVMRAADAAMYHAKALGKNNFQFYSPELNLAVHDHLLLEASLTRAIGNHEMLLSYQPKVDLRSGSVVGAEALVRWRHPVHGVTLPGRFIPIAEETGLIVPLGAWVISEACAVLRRLQPLTQADFTISVNLSARQMRQRDFTVQLGRTLARFGVDPQHLELEVTESQLMDQPTEALELLANLKQLGVKLSIDDFGTGYSSLSYLQRFPVDHIKIDRSFLSHLEREDNAVITRAIIALGHSLRLTVIAEGVETPAQLEFVRAHDCDQMQGHYFSPAVPRSALERILRSGQRLA